MSKSSEIIYSENQIEKRKQLIGWTVRSELFIRTCLKNLVEKTACLMHEFFLMLKNQIDNNVRNK